MLSGEKPQVRRPVASGTATPQRQRQVRLSRQQKDELIERFHAGAFNKELARAYGVHIETVRAIIRLGPE